MIFGGSKGPNISPSMCHVMFNPLAALIKPLWGGKGCLWCNLTFVTKNWHFWAQNCHCWHFCSILVLIYGGVKGSNRLTRMWHAIVNPFEALFNQFGATGSLYGQMWQFWALKQVFFETPCTNFKKITRNQCNPVYWTYKNIFWFLNFLIRCKKPPTLAQSRFGPPR